MFDGHVCSRLSPASLPCRLLPLLSPLLPLPCLPSASSLTFCSSSSPLSTFFGGLLLFGGLYPQKIKKSPKKCEIPGLLNLGVKSPEKIRYAPGPLRAPPARFSPLFSLLPQAGPSRIWGGNPEIRLAVWGGIPHHSPPYGGTK